MTRPPDPATALDAPRPTLPAQALPAQISPAEPESPPLPIPAGGPREPPLRSLTVRQHRFVEEYRVDGVAAAAARRAGYSAASARWTGRDLLATPHVRAALEKAEPAHAAMAALSPDRRQAMSELGRIAFANLMDYVSVGADGELDLDLGRLDRASAAAVKELTIDQTTDPRTGAVHKRIRFKLADKQAALARFMTQSAAAAKEREAWLEAGRDQGRAELFRGGVDAFRNEQAKWRLGGGW
jgi:phage terminase small subunit